MFVDLDTHFVAPKEQPHSPWPWPAERWDTALASLAEIRRSDLRNSEPGFGEPMREVGIEPTGKTIGKP